MTATAVRRSIMATFNIDAENSITALGSQQADFEGEIFASQQELADLAAKWPANRLSEIWKAIQSLDGGGPTEGATTTPKPASKAKAPAKQPKKAKTAKAKAAKR